MHVWKACCIMHHSVLQELAKTRPTSFTQTNTFQFLTPNSLNSLLISKVLRHVSSLSEYPQQS